MPQLKIMEVCLSPDFSGKTNLIFVHVFLCIIALGRDNALEGWANKEWDVGL